MTYQPVRAVTKNDIMTYLTLAREVIPFYERENENNGHRPAAPVESVDQVALDYFEREEGVIVVGTALHGDDIHVYAIDGKLATNDNVEWTIPGNQRTYNFRNFKRSTTINRFLTSVCAIVHERRLHHDDHPEISGLMMESNRTERTQQILSRNLQ